MPAIRLFAGSVYGAALETARDIEEELQDAGFDATLTEAATATDFTRDPDTSAVLICTSTTGTGELPPSLQPLYQTLRETLPLHEGRPYGLIVLGDSSYGDSYCGAAQLMETLLNELCYTPVKPTLRIDAMEITEPSHIAVPWALDWAQSL